MRGKDRVELHRGLFGGITPACAGKSARPTPASTAWSDHPRVCGEKRWKTAAALLMSGSPPRMRGKVCVIGRAARVRGITPAYAGKSERTDWTITCHRDHPRVCGEKPAPRQRAASCRGSPPRMRGKGFPAALSCRRARITPAYAGKRHPLDTASLVRQDHPRVCGEKTKKIP